MRYPRAFNESEAQARARAEVDPATRARITWAHDHVAAVLGESGATLRRRGYLAVAGRQSNARYHVHAAGLTLGEAKAAGLFR